MAASDFQLTMRSGPTPGENYLIDQEELVLGRDLANEIAISDPEVSRRHARFFMQGENVMVEDLGSTNGSFLNGERISSPQQLRAGDVITLGESIVLVFEKAGYDPDATVVTTRGERTVQRSTPERHSYLASSEPAAIKQPEPSQQMAGDRPAKSPSGRGAKEKKGGLPTWLIILLIAIVVIGCVIAVTLYFMPASWWCALTLDMLEGCPIQ